MMPKDKTANSSSKNNEICYYEKKFKTPAVTDLANQPNLNENNLEEKAVQTCKPMLDLTIHPI